MLRFDHPRDDRATRRGRTIVIDYGPDAKGWTGRRGLADLLEAAGRHIDIAKIWALNAVLMPDDYLRDVVRLYDEVGIETFAGGLLFEYAWLENDIDGLIARLRHLAIGGIEVSENYVPLTDDERQAVIERLRGAGLEVVFEFGRKHPDKPLELDELDRVIAAARGAGAEHVILEQGELDMLEQAAPEALDALRDRDWFEVAFIEIDEARFPGQAVELIERFGPEVNLANVPAGHAIRLEGFRRGLGRAMDYPYFRKRLAQRRRE